MKKLVLLIALVLVSSIAVSAARPSDRDWTVKQLNVSAGAVRSTNTQSGMLWVQNHGADAYIAFNATADVTDIQLPDGGSIDFYPASVRYGEYFTVYSAGSTSVNFVILD